MLQHDVFISFSFKDQAVTEYVSNKLLNEYHISYWMCTRDLVGGDHFKESIAQAIKGAKIVLMIQSAHSLASREVPKEVAIALDNNKPVIPFVLDNAELCGDLEYDLIGIHRIDARKPTLDERIEELARQIYSMLQKKATQKDAWAERFLHSRLLSTATVIPKKVFCGRDSILSEMHAAFAGGERVLFLYGIGGIGKTQIAKQYIKKYKDDYDTVVFATYSGSLRDMVVASSPFCLEPEMHRFTMSDGSTEPDAAFFERKLEKIKKISNERTLIVIDNFDVDDDACLTPLIEGGYRLLITTRCDYSRYYPTIRIDSIGSMDSLIDIFMQNYGGFDVEADDPALPELIELVNRHTYTVELLAQHMENSGQTAREMIEALKKEGIASLTETITDAQMQKNTAYENLIKMFRLFTLREDEKRILMYLSFMPIDGINVRAFREWASLDSCKEIKELEKKSWLIKNTEGIALHPIIREVIRHEMPVTEENCGAFCRRFTDAIEDKKMWVAKEADKNRYAQIARNIAEKFSEICAATEDFYYFFQSLLSFNVDFGGAVELADRLYKYNLATYGEKSFKTARAAFKRGWIYTTNTYLSENIEEAIFWLEKADGIFKQVEMETNDEISRHTMTKTNLSKMYLFKYRQSGEAAFYEKAKMYVLDAIDHARQNFPFGDFHYAKIGGALMQYAEVLTTGNELATALKATDESIDILVNLFGTDDNSDMGYAYYLKAVIFYAMGNKSEAAIFAEKGVDNHVKYFNKSHPQVHALYVLLGDCFAADGNGEKAKENYSLALESALLTFSPAAKQVTEIRKKIADL